MAATRPEPISPQTDQPPRHRPWGWIAICLVLGLLVVGLVIWGAGLQSDLDGQRDAATKAQQEATQAQGELDAISGQVDDLTQQVSDAGNQLEQSGADAEQALGGIRSTLTALKQKVKDAAAEQPASGDAEGG